MSLPTHRFDLTKFFLLNFCISFLEMYKKFVRNYSTPYFCTFLPLPFKPSSKKITSHQFWISFKFIKMEIFLKKKNIPQKGVLLTVEISFLIFSIVALQKKPTQKFIVKISFTFKQCQIVFHIIITRI